MTTRFILSAAAVLVLIAGCGSPAKDEAVDTEAAVTDTSREVRKLETPFTLITDQCGKTIPNGRSLGLSVEVIGEPNDTYTLLLHNSSESELLVGNINTQTSYISEDGEFTGGNPALAMAHAPRKIEPGHTYTIENFVVQSPTYTCGDELGDPAMTFRVDSEEYYLQIEGWDGSQG